MKTMNRCRCRQFRILWRYFFCCDFSMGMAIMNGTTKESFFRVSVRSSNQAGLSKMAVQFGTAKVQELVSGNGSLQFCDVIKQAAEIAVAVFLEDDQ